MDSNSYFQKSFLGIQEINSRSRRLPPKLRSILILIDGHRSEQMLREKAQQIGAPENFLEELVRARFIVERAVEPAPARTESYVSMGM